MANRVNVDSLRGTTLRPQARPTDTYFRPEMDNSKGQKLQQLSNVLDKVVPVAQEAAEAQFRQRSREKEAEVALLATTNFTNWTTSLDPKLQNLPKDQYGQALQGKFGEFLGGIEDPNEKIMYQDMFSRHYANDVNRHAGVDAQKAEQRKWDTMGTRLWQVINDPNLDSDAKSDSIEELVNYGHNEFGWERELLNDWLVERQVEFANYNDDRENFAVYDWMTKYNRLGVGKYQDSIGLIQHERRTRRGDALEMERFNSRKDRMDRLTSGQLTDEWYESKIKNGTFTAAQVASFKADDEKYRLGILSEQQVQNLAKQQVASVLGEPAFALPPELQANTEFTTAAQGVADRLNMPVSWLYSIMAFETKGTFDPTILNEAGSGAIGLIQFMPDTAKGIGTTTNELAKMTETEQLAYVEKYYKQFNKPIRKPSDLYLLTIYPEALGMDQDAPLFQEGTIEYTQNKGLDVDGDGVITPNEIRRRFDSDVHAKPFLFNGSMGTTGLGTSDITLPNGKTHSVADQNAQVIAAYEGMSTLIAESNKENIQQRAIREIETFWGSTGKTLANTNWKRTLETGFNHAMGRLGDGDVPPETLQMASMLYKEMEARAPHILSNYLDEDQRSFYEAARVYETDLAQTPEQAFLSARRAYELSIDEGRADGLKEQVDKVSDDFLYSDNGWFFTNIGADVMANQPQVASKIKDMYSSLMKLGINADQATRVVERRMATDYRTIGNTLIDVSSREIMMYGPDKLVMELATIKSFMTGVDPDYAAYMEEQGIESMEFMQDSRFPTRFFLMDNNGNLVPPITLDENGEVERGTGVMQVTLENAEKITDEIAEQALKARFEANNRDQAGAAGPNPYWGQGSSASSPEQVITQREEVLKAMENGLTTTEEQKLKEKYGAMWGFDSQGLYILNQ